MFFPKAFILAALPFLVSAAVVDQNAEPVAKRTTTIGLNRRSNLRQADGAVNLTGLRSHLAHTTTKVRKGLETYERNMGARHPSDLRTEAHKRAVGHDALKDDESELWYGSISVGTPAVKYTVDFDTGSSDLFLPANTCGSTCSGHTKYNPSSSSSSKALGKSFSLQYGDGSTVSGKQYTDKVQIAGLTATKQTLGAASQYSTGFQSSEFPADGLMGMAFKSLSEYNANPVFQSLVAQGQTTDGVFAFKLTASGSELTIGGVNDDLYTGDFTYVPVTEEAYWQVDLDSVNVGTKKGVSGLSAIIDSGTTLIVGDPSEVAQFYRSVPGAKSASSTVGDGYYTFPCSSVPSVSLTFGGKSFKVSADTFNLGQVSQGSSLCVGGIVGQDVGIDAWIVGDVFMSNVYTVFDVDNSQVGFANLA